MSVVVGSGVVLSGAVVSDAANGNNPIIGYQSYVTTSNISSTTAEAEHPTINLANEATHLYWRAVLGSPLDDEYVTIITDTNELLDYVGIARHNLFTGLIPVSIEGQQINGGAWSELVADVILPSDGPAIFRFSEQSLYAVRIRMQASMLAVPVPAEIGVVYVGKLLVLQRRIYVGHTPITLGRQTKVVNGRSESGNFLGRIVLNESRMTQVNMANLIPSWYRENMDPFVEDAVERPFFFAWRPFDYPYEVGYVWMTEDPKPNNQLSNGMMQVSFSVMGVA